MTKLLINALMVNVENWNCWIKLKFFIQVSTQRLAYCNCFYSLLPAPFIVCCCQCCFSFTFLSVIGRTVVQPKQNTLNRSVVRPTDQPTVCRRTYFASPCCLWLFVIVIVDALVQNHIVHCAYFQCVLVVVVALVVCDVSSLADVFKTRLSSSQTSSLTNMRMRLQDYALARSSTHSPAGGIILHAGALAYIGLIWIGRYTQSVTRSHNSVLLPSD